MRKPLTIRIDEVSKQRLDDVVKKAQVSQQDFCYSAIMEKIHLNEVMRNESPDPKTQNQTQTGNVL